MITASICRTSANGRASTRGRIAFDQRPGVRVALDEGPGRRHADQPLGPRPCPCRRRCSGRTGEQVRRLRAARPERRQHGVAPATVGSPRWRRLHRRHHVRPRPAARPATRADAPGRCDLMPGCGQRPRHDAQWLPMRPLAPSRASRHDAAPCSCRRRAVAIRAAPLRRLALACGQRPRRHSASAAAVVTSDRAPRPAGRATGCRTAARARGSRARARTSWPDFSVPAQGAADPAAAAQ